MWVDESLTDSRLVRVDDSRWELTKTLTSVNYHVLASSFSRILYDKVKGMRDFLKGGKAKVKSSVNNLSPSVLISFSFFHSVLKIL